MRRIVHADDAHAELVGKLHATIHGLVGHGLSELVVSVPGLRCGETRGEFFDPGARGPAPDFASKKVVEMKCFQGIVGANTVACRTMAEAGGCFCFILAVASGKVGPGNELVVCFRRNNEPSFSHSD